MILRVDAYSAGKRGKRGSHSPFAISNSDWLLQRKSPIRELPITASLIPLTEEGPGRTKPGDPHPSNSKYCEFPVFCVCLGLCVRAHVYVCECVWVPLASLVSHRVLNYPMGALIELETLLIVSLDEGEIEGRKGEQSGAARQD